MAQLKHRINATLLLDIYKFEIVGIANLQCKYDAYLYLFLRFSSIVPISRNESSPVETPGATKGVMLVRAKQLVAVLAISLC